MSPFIRRHFLFCASAAAFAWSGACGAAEGGVPTSYATPPEVHERLQKFIPRAYEKLQKRQGIHVLAVGDEILDMAGHGDDDGNQLLAWPAQFAAELAREFALTGGVRLVSPNPGKPDKSLTSLGAEITLRVVSAKQGTLRSSLAAALAFGGAPAPDLIVVGAGAQDALRGGDLMFFAESIHDLTETLKAVNADVMLVSAPVLPTEPLDRSLGLTRPCTGVLRDLAIESGIAFADLGDLSGFIRFRDDRLTPESVLGDVAKQLRQFFAWSDKLQDNERPTPRLHHLLGELVYQQLAHGPAAAPWSVQPGEATRVSDTQLRVQCEVTNLTKSEQTLALQVLPTQTWVAQEQSSLIKLRRGEKKMIHLTLNRSASADSLQFPSFAAHEPILRLPLLIATPGFARIEEVQATLKPLAMIWKLDAMFNQLKGFTLDNMLVNTTDAALKNVEWQAEWAGQKKQGKIDIEAGKSATLPLAFDLPADSGARRIASPLLLNVRSGSSQFTWMRAIEASENMGLEADTALASTGAQKGTATLRAEAGEKQLDLVFDLGKTDASAVRAQLHIDARSYGKRLTTGSTEDIVVQQRADGSLSVSPVAPWAFGTGYGMKFDPNGIGAKLSTDATGHRLLTVTVPRSYLYLHEWAIGNGNSQLGIHAEVSVGNETFRLSQNGRDPDDTGSMIALELTTKPTARWTVTVW